MSLASVCAWSFLRSVLIALVAAFVSKPIAKSIASLWDSAGQSIGVVHDRPSRNSVA